MSLFRKRTKFVKDYIPRTGLNLVSVSRNEVLEKVGDDVMQRIVASILCGGNVRSLTEGLTRRRLSLSNASMLYAYFRSIKHIDGFLENPLEIVKEDFLNSKLSSDEQSFLNWMIGLSGKGIQNILRSDPDAVGNYLQTLDRELSDAAKKVKEEFGDLTTRINIQDETFSFGWKNLLQIFMAIGAQTLTIRGSEKSVYGKLFERLVLGSVLTLLGFSIVDKDDTEKTEKVFWLSEQKDKRESDATLLVRSGVGARFDIGFIGKGNSEISLDKVSRFEREMERGRQKHFVSTIVLVDTIGDRSRIREQAKEIDGTIIQMSMSYWVKELAQVMKIKLKYEHEITEMDDDKALEYVSEKMKSMDLSKFLP